MYTTFNLRVFFFIDFNIYISFFCIPSNSFLSTAALIIIPLHIFLVLPSPPSPNLNESCTSLALSTIAYFTYSTLLSSSHNLKTSRISFFGLVFPRFLTSNPPSLIHLIHIPTNLTLNSTTSWSEHSSCSSYYLHILQHISLYLHQIYHAHYFPSILTSSHLLT